MTTPAKRADHGVRILTAPDTETVAREFRRVGCMDEGVAIMTPKGLHRLVRLERVQAKVANILKQEMLGYGGDAAVHGKTVACGIEHTDVVLLGTEQQLRRLCEKLHRQPFGLAATGDAILAALQAFDGGAGVLHCGRYHLPLGRKTYVMGIINMTPDSFSGEGLDGDIERARRQAEQMIADGAHLLDVGGESTRPGSEPVSEAEELRRVVPVIAALAKLDVPISVDTTKSAVARAAVEAGATLINDISGLRFDPQMASVAAETGMPVVVMHIKGTPRTMQQDPEYADLMTDICAYLQESTVIAMAAGVPREQVVLDPGFGFGKTVEHNLEILRRLRELTSFGQPILLGTSRKGTIGQVLGGLPPQDRIEGTAATVAIGITNGADIIRVHDVKAMARVAKMTDAIVRNAEYGMRNAE